MTIYYLSNEPPRRRMPWWGWALLGLLLGAGVVAAAVIVDPREYIAAPADGALPPPASVAEWRRAIAAATTPTADTIYLVDTSESMTRELPNVKQGLSDSIAAKARGSRVGIIAFGDTSQEILPLLDLKPELAETAVSAIEIGMAGRGTNVGRALEQARGELNRSLEQERTAEVVLFSDGSLASVTRSECHGGQEVRSAQTLEGKRLTQCVGGAWQHQPAPIIAQFLTDGIAINGIYFQPHLYDWADQVELLTTATGGEFVRVR